MVSVAQANDNLYLAHAIQQVDQLLKTSLHNRRFAGKKRDKGRMERMVTGIISRAKYENLMRELRPQIYDLLQRVDSSVERWQPTTARCACERDGRQRRGVCCPRGRLGADRGGSGSASTDRSSAGNDHRDVNPTCTAGRLLKSPTTKSRARTPVAANRKVSLKTSPPGKGPSRSRKSNSPSKVREDLAVEFYALARLGLHRFGLTPAEQRRALKRSWPLKAAPRVSGPLLRDARSLSALLLEWSRSPQFVDAKGAPERAADQRPRRYVRDARATVFYRICRSTM